MRAKFEELKILIYEYLRYLFVLPLEETMIGINKAPCPRDYSFYPTEFNAERGSHGGSALLIRNDISRVPIDLHSSLQAVAVQIKLVGLQGVRGSNLEIECSLRFFLS